MKFGPFRLFEKKSLPQTDDDLAALLGLSASTDPLCVPPVAAAVRTIGEAVATLDINVIKRDATGEKVDHASLTLLRGQVNDWTSGFELIRDLITQALTRDAGGMAWVNRVNDRIAEIIRYEPGRITAQYASDGSGEPTYSLNGRPLNAADVIHVRGPFSKSPVSLARGAICTAATMEAHARRQFETGAKPGAVVTVPKGMGEDSIKKMRAGFRAAYEGATNAGRTVFIYDGATFTTAQITSVDAQFLELRRFQTEEIARAFGIPVSMIGDLTKSSYANAEQRQLEFLAYTLDPWLSALEAAFNRTLLSDDERATLTFKFDRDDLTRASLTERATAINSPRASEVLSADEGRDWLGLAARADGKGSTYTNPNITVEPSAKPKPEAT